MIIRHDTADSAYVVDDADYPALVDLFEPGDCIGTVVDDSYLLTVAHCAEDLEVGQPLDVGGVRNGVAEVVLHPRWCDDDNYDVALVRLDSAVMHVTPLPIYRGTEEASAMVTLVGRGATASGLVGEDGASTDGKLRRATNTVSDVDDYFIEVSFEAPGQPGVTDLEGVGAAGDSGCPVFIEHDGATYIAGLNSFGEGGDGVGVGQYGSKDYQTRVSTHASWIDRTIAGEREPSQCDGCSVGGEGSALALLAVLVAWRCGTRARQREPVSDRTIARKNSPRSGAHPGQ